MRCRECPCALGLTLPSSGRFPAGCARFQPPLMSNASDRLPIAKCVVAEVASGCPSVAGQRTIGLSHPAPSRSAARPPQPKRLTAQNPLANGGNEGARRLLSLRGGSNEAAFHAGGCHRLQLLSLPSHRRSLGLLRVWHCRDSSGPRSHCCVCLGRQNAANHSLQDLWLRHPLGAAGTNARLQAWSQPRKLRPKAHRSSAGPEVRRCRHLEIHRRLSSLKAEAKLSREAQRIGRQHSPTSRGSPSAGFAVGSLPLMSNASGGAR